MKNALILAGMVVVALTGCGEKKVLKRLLRLLLPPLLLLLLLQLHPLPYLPLHRLFLLLPLPRLLLKLNKPRSRLGKAASVGRLFCGQVKILNRWGGCRLSYNPVRCVCHAKSHATYSLIF